jgi:2-polyprenyl-6-methoxyphenol hydroxylase-like FAD-dependent oxidoreductase
MSTRTALIVGAGIGGLSAGIALRKAGWKVRIFERAGSPRELGFGLGLAPNAMAALAELGVADVVLERGFAPASLAGEVRRLDGTVLKSVREFPLQKALGGPMVIALRPALHGALLEAVGPEAIQVNREAVGFTPDGTRVRLHLRDGDTAEGDMLIGADGANSMVRRVLHPSEPPPRSSGIIAVRGAVHGAHHHLGDLHAVYYLDRGIESVVIRASDTGIYWFLSVASELIPSGMRAPADIVAHMAPRLDVTLQRVASATDDLRCDELVDRDPIPVWGTGVVTLLGDAAHPLLPHTGQGAAQAIVDAVTLGRLAGITADVVHALRNYESERQPKTAVLVGQGRRTARMMRSTNPLACYIRELVVRCIPVGRMAKLIMKINRRAGTDVTALVLAVSLAAGCAARTSESEIQRPACSTGRVENYMDARAQRCWYNTTAGSWRIVNHDFHYDTLVVETEATKFDVGDEIVRRFEEVHGERFSEMLIYVRVDPRTRRLRWLRGRGVDVLEFDS